MQLGTRHSSFNFIELINIVYFTYQKVTHTVQVVWSKAAVLLIKFITVSTGEFLNFITAV